MCRHGWACPGHPRFYYSLRKPGSGHDLFFKMGPSSFRVWDSSNDPPPQYGTKVDRRSNTLDGGGDDETDEADDGREPALSSSDVFAYERDLKNYLAKNLLVLEPGLTLYQDEGISGIEFPVGDRFIDILAVDASGGYVIVELKVSRGYDRAVGQLLRYMAWVRNNLANGARVRRIIVANEITDDLKMAASIVPDVQLAEYEIAFKLKPLQV